MATYKVSAFTPANNVIPIKKFITYVEKNTVKQAGAYLYGIIASLGWTTFSYHVEELLTP